MDARREAGVDQRPAGVDERPRAVQDGRDAREAGGDRGGIVEAEDPAREAELAGEPLDRRAPPAGENRRETAGDRLAGDELAGVAVGSVDGERAGHGERADA